MPELEHSERGPSGAHRWRRCKASVIRSRGYPDESGEEAEQGTVFHEFAALCLEFGLEPHGFIGATHRGSDGVNRPFTEEMADGMIYGLDIVRSYSNAPEVHQYIETKVNLERWVGPKEFGTTDAAVVNLAAKRMVVFDWKWGMVPVTPDWNDQAILYALGIWATFAEKLFSDAGISPSEVEVVVIIEQPRAPGGGGTWPTTMSALLAEGEIIKKDAAETHDENAAATPGEKQCQYCVRSKTNTCVERASMFTDMIFDLFEEAESDHRFGLPTPMKDARALSPEERTQVVLAQGSIVKWMESLVKEATRDAELGQDAPGLKLIAGRGLARAWKDDKLAEDYLEQKYAEEAYNKKLKSPTMIEADIGKAAFKKEFKHHVRSPLPKPKLVSEDNPKEALPTISSMYDDIL